MQDQNVLELLLGMEPPQQRTARIKMRQLSESAGKDIIFTVRALPYDRVREIEKQEDGVNGHAREAIILAGVTEPNLKDAQLLEKYHVPTPYELLPKLLTAGEVDELSLRIERLSGYRRSVTELVEDVQKK